ncbi:AAA family ATPase [Methylobacterium gnaphalii]|uniref:AAA family ATPase n=1 Tax=Methylobacterium gnaphalii TaxID=1010610 RepID=UPI0024536D08|nr:AAA family ATPase [Methylobacterium gnaphalii]
MIALVSQKGGVGKSTLSINLAALAGEKEPAMIIDRDAPQCTASKWWNRRQDLEPPPAYPELIDIGQTPLKAAVTKLKPQPGFLFLDTRPAVGAAEAEAVQAADFVIVPVKAAIVDIEAIALTLDIIRRLDRKALIVVNAAKNDRRATDARAALSRFPVSVCPHHLSDRAAYLDAPIDGLSVMEMQGAGARAAEHELRQVWQWALETMNG